jgi:hypothetical protein
MEELKAKIHSINEQLNEEDLKPERKRFLLNKRGKFEYKITMAERGIIYCCYCYCNCANYSKHEQTKTHHENKWKEK